MKYNNISINIIIDDLMSSSHIMQNSAIKPPIINNIPQDILEKKPKVVVFDVDETLGHFGQFGIFFDTLSEFYKNPNILYTHFNAIIDLYPEVYRPNIVRILDYIRKKKQSGLCSKVMIYTNNQGPGKWIPHIRGYLEKKLEDYGANVANNIQHKPLFDRIIGGFKVPTMKVDPDQPERTTDEKTIDDFLRCSRLPSNVEICFLDDLNHPKMVNEKVYYIKLQSYHSYIPFEQFITRFLNSKVYEEHFAGLTTRVTQSLSSATNRQIQKQMTAIEMNNVLLHFIKLSKYDAKKEHIRVNPREIDEIISKYILFHLQQFFKETKPTMHIDKQPGSAASSCKSKTRKCAKSQKSVYSSLKKRVFIVNKEEALKAYKNEKTVNRSKSMKTKK